MNFLKERENVCGEIGRKKAGIFLHHAQWLTIKCSGPRMKKFISQEKKKKSGYVHLEAKLGLIKTKKEMGSYTREKKKIKEHFPLDRKTSLYFCLT